MMGNHTSELPTSRTSELQNASPRSCQRSERECEVHDKVLARSLKSLRKP